MTEDQIRIAALEQEIVELAGQLHAVLGIVDGPIGDDDFDVEFFDTLSPSDGWASVEV